MDKKTAKMYVTPAPEIIPWAGGEVPGT